MGLEEDAVVVPLVPLQSEPSTETMLRMLLNREALVISRAAKPAESTTSGMIAPASGAFAKAISQAIGQAGRAPSNDALYRVILPSGSVARDLVPAVGGGFRGIARAAGSTKVAGHVRLVPAAAGTGATLAAGPLIATVGLAVAGEMLAQHQMNKKLDAIKNSVAGIQFSMDEDERSVLATAEQQAHNVAGYLLDQAELPHLSSVSHAFGGLDTLTTKYISRLERWLEVAEKHRGSDRVYGPDLMKELVDKRDNPVREFEQMVTQTYQAVALRARVVVLEKIAAEFANADRPLPHVEKVLRDQLSGLAARQEQLVGLLDDLNVLQIDSSKVPVAFAGKSTLEARTSFGRLARALHSAPDSLPLLTESDQTVLELAPTAEGLDVITPAVE
ncbi:hypothetical protein [Paenarthrobacter ureafaciens]|uniref:hypothetical protein n=1 Tax=Paenarthrobacter ureafaciens TaxID=37931 RepID=UPI002DBB47E6|nr:hypothetical protein [Paenarthrobacter ureafaciens]MEC3853729.1 hypothetical protein [Paenarthrobacter ureafaciens]